MTNGFDQLFDFQHRKALKMKNSSYLEELTGLLAMVASRITEEKYYFFDNEFYLKDNKKDSDNSFEDFVNDIKNTIYNGSHGEINIIFGKAGIGKSLFFKKGILQLVRDSDKRSDKYIHMGVDFKNIDNDKDIKFYIKWIYKKLCNNAIDCIRAIGRETYKTFEDEYESFGKKYKTPHMRLFPLKYFCEKIYYKYKKPCIIVLDNIDLASVPTQESVIGAIVNIFDEFSRFMGKDADMDCYRIYFTMRSETELRFKEGKWGQIIDFPLPNILKISLATIKCVLFEVAKEFDENEKLPCHVTCQDILEDKQVTYETFYDVAEYFYRILDYFLSNIWNANTQIIERLGTSQEFHCNIVNYNVRTFLRFLSDTISNGGFKPLTIKFNRDQGTKYYSIYDYIEMIIRGKWIIHPGNRNINGEGGNRAPIIFNLFDTDLYGDGLENRVKHFMLYIRILQYLYLGAADPEIEYREMEQALGHFFNRECICDATKKLIYVRFLYSYVHGDNFAATIKNWQGIAITQTTILELSPVGRFYLEKMICEFEYQYQMALSSLICEVYVNNLKINWRTEKELTVLYFLQSIYQIIKININTYSPEDLKMFKKLFCFTDNNYGDKPLRRMICRFISVMKNKVQRAERLDANNKAKLNKILNEAIELEKKANTYFDSVLEV